MAARLETGADEDRCGPTRLYAVEVKVAAVPRARWEALCRDCTGGVASVVELLQGRFSNGIMERLRQEGTGLFPRPAEIAFRPRARKR